MTKLSYQWFSHGNINTTEIPYPINGWDFRVLRITRSTIRVLYTIFIQGRTQPRQLWWCGPVDKAWIWESGHLGSLSGCASDLVYNLTGQTLHLSLPLFLPTVHIFYNCVYSVLKGQDGLFVFLYSA